MADAEFHDPERVELLEALRTALDVDAIPPTAWACLWLSDLDRLRERLREAQTYPHSLILAFQGMESSAKIVQKCVCLQPDL